MTRLLLLTPSELTQDPRARRAAQAALARGLEVVGLSGRLSGEFVAELEGVTVRRVGKPPETVSAAGAGEPHREPLRRELVGLYRLLRLAGRTFAFRRAGKGLGPFDIVHANDFDTLPAGFLLARASRARLAYDAHEIYAEFESDPPRLYNAVLKALEGTLARRANAVVTVNEPIADELHARLKLSGPPGVVLNCPDLEEEEPVIAPPEEKLRATYLGWLGGPGRTLEDVFEAAQLAPNVEFTLRLVRTDLPALRASVDALGLGDRIRVADPVRPDRLFEALRGFHVGLVIDRPVSRNSELVLPNKLFEYMMAGLAVVAPRLPAIERVVEDGGVGVTFEPGRPDLLADALESLAADPARLEGMRRRARALAVERFNAERQAATLHAAWGLDR